MFEKVIEKIRGLTRQILPLQTIFVENADQMVFASAAAHEQYWSDYEVVVGTQMPKGQPNTSTFDNGEFLTRFPLPR